MFFKPSLTPYDLVIKIIFMRQIVSEIESRDATIHVRW